MLEINWLAFFLIRLYRNKHDSVNQILLGTHTARRSFNTNAYLAKVDPVQIMKITGHRSEKMLLRYIKVSSEQNAMLLLDHAHF